MLPLPLRNWIFSNWIRVDNRVRRVPWFAFTDLVFFPKFGTPIAGHFLRNYHLYRKNLGELYDFSLTQFYPRSGYLLYYYLLFTWAEYCCYLDQLLERPRLSLIAESFMRYIVEVDRIIDSRDGLRLLGHDVETVRSHARVAAFRESFVSQVGKADLTTSIKHTLLDEIAIFETASQKVCCTSAGQVNKPVDVVLKVKEATVGALFSQWAQFLNLIYKVPQECHSPAQSLFGNTGMALQMLDDTLDVPIDFDEETDNTFICVARGIEDEWMVLMSYLAYLKRTPWRHLDTIWAGRYTPITLSKIQDLSECYLNRMDGFNQPVASRLRWVMERLKAHAMGI